MVYIERGVVMNENIKETDLSECLKANHDFFKVSDGEISGQKDERKLKSFELLWCKRCGTLQYNVLYADCKDGESDSCIISNFPQTIIDITGNYAEITEVDTDSNSDEENKE